MDQRRPLNEVENVKANGVALISVLTACAIARDLKTLKRVNECIDDNGSGYHNVLMTARI